MKFTILIHLCMSSATLFGKQYRTWLQLPDEEFQMIIDIPDLKRLDLSKGSLVHLRDDIDRLEGLEELDLDSNDLRSLPESIGRLRNLKTLVLTFNCLTWLPRTITLLKDNGIIIHLWGNRSFCAYGLGDTLGGMELEAIFGDKVNFSRFIDPSEKAFRKPCWGQLPRLSKKEVYEKLSARRLSWSVDKLKHMVLHPVPQHRRSAEEMLSTWKSITSRCHGDASDVEQYIETLYRDGPDVFKGMVYEESADTVKNLVEAILVRLERGSAEVWGCVVRISSALRNRPDRQVAALTRVYNALHFDADHCLRGWITQEIAIMKNYTFEMVREMADVPTRNGWKMHLRDELGLAVPGGAVVKPLGDSAKASEGAILYAFYSKFTPEYMINALTEEIGKDEWAQGLALAYLGLGESCYDESWARARTAYILPSLIDRQNVKEILLKMKILKKRSY